MQITVLTPASPRWRALLDQTPHDIYQRPAYISLEADRTRTQAEALMIEDPQTDRTLLAPYLLRRCDDVLPPGLGNTCLDVVSPYGYPGLLLSPAAQADPDFLPQAITALRHGLGERGVCAAFFRLHPCLNAGFATQDPGCAVVNHGETVALDLTLPLDQIWKDTKSSHRNKINRCHRQGLVARMVPCQNHLSTFVAIYAETMARVEAGDLYFQFNQHYFEKLHQVLGVNLHLCVVEVDGEVASAGLYSEAHGIVQALFGGTRTRFYAQSPSSLETDFVRRWAKHQGYQVLHLGGGVGAAQDSLYHFKAGFGPGRWQFQSLRIVPDAARYHNLIAQRAKVLGIDPARLTQGSFFPAYRAA
ncbi:MAG: hypothetical protein RLZZ597_1614 [Cyanobacteriota bacterium]|jgi:hypothetical protein